MFAYGIFISGFQPVINREKEEHKGKAIIIKSQVKQKGISKGENEYTVNKIFRPELL